MPTSQNIPSNPLISFIVTTFDLPAEMIRECIESILRLSLARDEREIIIVDDGSDIPALNDLTDLQDQITYIRQPNQGPSAARNRGLQCATGKFIQFVDGDDYIIQAPYEHCLDIVRFREADVVLFHETTKTQPEVPFIYDGPVSGVSFMRHNNLRASACGYLFRRSILGSLRFTPGILHEDEEFTPQLMLRAEQVYSTKSEAYFYRKRVGSRLNKIGRRHTVKRQSDTIHVILKLRDIAETLPETDQVAVNRRIAQLSMDYLYNTIKLTHSHKQLNKAMNRLRRYGLYPLPDKNYTKKYRVFKKLVDSSIGRWILLLTIR